MVVFVYRHLFSSLIDGQFFSFFSITFKGAMHNLWKALHLRYQASSLQREVLGRLKEMLFLIMPSLHHSTKQLFDWPETQYSIVFAHHSSNLLPNPFLWHSEFPCSN